MKQSNSRKKILFAEDDDAMRRFIEVILQKAGYEVISVEDGLQALTAALEADFDAIVADAVMPNMSGFDLCRMLRGNVEKKAIPFVIMSGLEQDTNAEAENCIADVYLSKDNNIKENLTKTLSDIFNQKRL